MQEFQNTSDLQDAVYGNITAVVEFENEFTYFIRYHYYIIPNPNDYLAHRGKIK